MILILAGLLAIAGPPTADGGKAGEPRVQPLEDCEAGIYPPPGAAERAAWSAAASSNRLEDFSAFADNFPASRCAAAAGQWVAARELAAAGWARSYAEAPAGRRAAEVIGDPYFGITYGDYPPAAMSRGEQGAVTIAWTIWTDGQMQSCHVVQSSGSQTLDEATCRLATRRARFRPASDNAGRPVIAHASRRFLWRLNQDQSAPLTSTLIPGWRVRVTPRVRR